MLLMKKYEFDVARKVCLKDQDEIELVGCEKSASVSKR